MLSRRMTDAPVPVEEHVPTADQFVTLRGDWRMYKSLLALRGSENARPRVAYLDGVLELMSTSRSHEVIKKAVAGMVEAYCQDAGIAYTGAGQFTHESETEDAAVEPDECYIFGRDHLEQRRADLAIEVVWTHGGIKKLEIYRRLRVKEVWFWERDVIKVFILDDEGYREAARSIWVPDLDLALVARLATVVPTSDAVRMLRDSSRVGGA